MRIEDLLKREICEDLEGMLELDLGSDEHKASVDAVTKLIDREVELRKLEIEHQERLESRKAEEELKLKQMKEGRVDRIIGYVINVAGIVIPVIVTVWGTKVSLKFEEEGTITTSAGRNFFSRIFHKK